MCVAQFLNGNVVVYDLTWTAATVPLRIFKPEGLAMLDDFTLTAGVFSQPHRV